MSYRTDSSIAVFGAVCLVCAGVSRSGVCLVRVGGGYQSGAGAAICAGAGDVAADVFMSRRGTPPSDNLIVLTAFYKFTSPRNILLCANKSAYTKFPMYTGLYAISNFFFNKNKGQ